ncbi:hybrid sensor histidine kinase/response regulator [Fischerella thermalis CCMEE 5268]|uniref:histidine kinase n=1 Tax=Fischerella thermalis CCMEE 5268 TaxID=2019662 RepID=A0A2N6KMM7_9CYAN|nr:hybrid sensor histidine kinase/response regulator [Fischerella thermalis]PMB01232.1 hybrid sensor histidine kinase/response regulator [Fischerella thermalis CCMEE 5268]
MIENEKYRHLYKIASDDHIQKIEAGLLHLEKHPQDQAKLEQLLREIHSLKGDSRMLGVDDVETIAHQMEEIIATVQQGERVLTPQVFDCLYLGLDAVRKIAHEAVTGESMGISIFHVLAQLMGAQSNDSWAEIEEESAESELAAFAQFIAEQPVVNYEAELVQEPVIPTTDTFTQVSDNYQIDTIHVESQKLDQLLTQAGELVVTNSQFADWLTEIDQLLMLWKIWKREAFVSRLALNQLRRHWHSNELQLIQDFYNLVETRLEQLGTSLNQLRNRTFDDTTKLEIVSNELASGIYSLRLLPFSDIFNIFARTVRDLAKQQGKEVNLVIEGGETKVDKRILEQMKDPLMHILRNAIDHGIETCQERRLLAKSSTATICLRGYQSGSTVTIEVSDDGRGLDVEAIKQAAIRRDICSSEELARMSTAEIQALIFAPGFSTREDVTEISGRGVGLDVVRANVERLKGNIEVEFTPGKGCLFRITLNSSLATTNVLIMEVNQNPYAIPVEFVEKMLLVAPQEVFATETSQTILFEDQPVSVVWLADLLGLPVKAPTSTKALLFATKTIPCIILRIGSERLALLVDTLLEKQDIVLKPQSQLLAGMPNISGATILGNGKVCLVLNPIDLFKLAKKTTISITVKELAEQAQLRQKILLVEDSIPIRTQMQQILEDAGYEVTAAEDGEDGFNKLQADTFAAVISDVQMPNLDGLGLTTKIRQLPEYKDLPVILVTTLASEEHKRKGVEAGANAYITKSNFKQGAFLDTLRRLMLNDNI